MNPGLTRGAGAGGGSGWLSGRQRGIDAGNFQIEVRRRRARTALAELMLLGLADPAVLLHHLIGRGARM
jgi:hypothetical protein